TFGVALVKPAAQLESLQTGQSWRSRERYRAGVAYGVSAQVQVRQPRLAERRGPGSCPGLAESVRGKPRFPGAEDQRGDAGEPGRFVNSERPGVRVPDRQPAGRGQEGRIVATGGEGRGVDLDLVREPLRTRHEFEAHQRLPLAVAGPFAFPELW